MPQFQVSLDVLSAALIELQLLVEEGWSVHEIAVDASDITVGELNVSFDVGGIIDGETQYATHIMSFVDGRWEFEQAWPEKGDDR